VIARAIAPPHGATPNGATPNGAGPDLAERDLAQPDLAPQPDAIPDEHLPGGLTLTTRADGRLILRGGDAAFRDRLLGWLRAGG
jgi:hypothetical protein